LARARQLSVPAAAMVKQGGSVVEVAGAVVILEFTTAPLAKAFTDRFAPVFNQALSQVMGRDLTVAARPAAGAPGGPAAAGPGYGPAARGPATPQPIEPAAPTSAPEPEPEPGAEPDPEPPDTQPLDTGPFEAGPPDTQPLDEVEPGEPTLPTEPEPDEPSPDDPDAGVLGLTGAALIQQMLGGEIIEEIEDE
jgi:hypothetical protein